MLPSHPKRPTREQESATTSKSEVEKADKPDNIGVLASCPPKQERYKKTSGAANSAGENYEWKMLTLVFLRMLAAGHNFKLASNMEAAGLFDDIVMRYQLKSSDIWNVAYLQLKHKKNKDIQKAELIGISGDFCLVKYCVSYKAVSANSNLEKTDAKQFIIYTNANLKGDLVDLVETPTLLITGGTAVSFKAGGEIYQCLCEWVDFKNTITELRNQNEGQSANEVEIQIRKSLETVEYKNKAVKTCQDEMLKLPTVGNLKAMLKKLELVSDKDSYAMFLSKLLVYHNQANELKLDSYIKEEFVTEWKQIENTENALMINDFKEKVKLWWQKDNIYLTQRSPLWLGIIKSQTQSLSKSTVDEVNASGATFVDSTLQALLSKINEVGNRGGILNLRVDSRTAASSLKLSQCLTKFGSQDLNVLHVNMRALLDREDDVLSAWSTSWCPLLVLECNEELEQRSASRISSKILDVVGRNNENKLLVLIAHEKHELNIQLFHAECHQSFNDNVVWSDLSEETKNKFLSNKPFINGIQSQVTLLELLDGDRGFANKAGMEVISQLISNDLHFGKDLEDVGELFVSRRLKKSEHGQPFAVNTVSAVNEKVVLIVAEPGMGKSTFITHLAKSAKEKDSTAWIVHVKLNDCVQYLAAMDVKHEHEITARKFLEQVALSPENRLEKLLFWSLVHKLVVFVDGVDEVCPHYERQVFTLLTLLRDMEFSQLWVASRPVFQTKLEGKLRVTTLHMVPFSVMDQTEYFNKVWLAQNPFDNLANCKKVVEKLLAWLSNSLGKNNPILGVPLMISMIGETCQDRMVSGNDDNGTFRNDDRLDIMILYETFVKKKFDLYCAEKKKSSCRELAANLADEETLWRLMSHNHQLAALRVLFSPEEIADLQFEGVDKFDENLDRYLKEVSDGREKLGIIDNIIGKRPHFMHRSFAEYFAALWLTKNFQENRWFIEKILFKPTYKFVGEIFHRSLAKTHPLHIAVLNRDFQTTKSILTAKPAAVNKPDDGGRTPLHLAVLLNGVDKHPDCILILLYLIEKHKAKLDVEDKVLGWTPLAYAECARAWEALNILLENRGNVKKGWRDFIVKLSGWYKPDSRLMLDAARVASVSVVSYLTVERGGQLNCRGGQGETMIHLAAEGENIEMVEYLISQGLSLDNKDYEGNTALRYASPQALQHLLQRGLDLDSFNNQGLTVLQDAAQNGAYDLITTIMEVKPLNEIIVSLKIPEAQLNASLLCAAYIGSMEYVQKLVEAGASVYHRNKDGHTAAWVAMHFEHFEIMEWLLLRGCRSGDTLLHGACRIGDPEIVTFILTQGSNVDEKGFSGRTPLISASRKGHLEVVKLLLSMGARVASDDKNGRSPLYEASSKGHKDVVSLLLSHGAVVDLVDNKGRTALYASAWNNKTEVLTLLLETGASVDCRDELGWTPLHRVSSLGHEQAAAILLGHGADFNAADNQGWTPLHRATWNNQLDVMTLLLNNGAILECHAEDGWTPLHRASWQGHDQAVALLINHGAEVNTKDRKGWTPLQSATWNNKTCVVKLLLDKGACMETRAEEGWRPLDTAASQGHEQIAALLLRYGADVTTESKKGWTPLHIATVNNNLGVLKLLLDTGKFFDQPSANGARFTPLMVAAIQGHQNVVMNLLKGYNEGREGSTKLEYINMVDRLGWSAFHFAACFGHSEVISFLITQGGDANSLDICQRAPLHLAAWCNHPHALNVLLEAAIEENRAAIVNSRDNEGNNVLMYSAAGGCVDSAECLVRAGSKLTEVNNYRRTALMIASEHKNVSMVKYLLDAFSVEDEVMNKLTYITMVDKSGKTALDSADIESCEVIEKCLAGLIDRSSLKSGKSY